VTLGMTTSTYTLLHVLISFIGIGSGFAVMYGFLKAKRLDGITAIFLASTALTSLTGFGFKNEHITPGIVIGILSLVVLAIALVARYSFQMRGAWRWIYVVTASVALYFNVFVLVVQSFEKVPALNVLAPTQKEPPFAITQLVVLAIFVGLTIAAVRLFRTRAIGVNPPSGEAREKDAA
jgi:hypothetical protein